MLRDGGFNLQAFDSELAEMREGPLNERQQQALEALEHYRNELAGHLGLSV
jgi:hypothetical protein